MLVKKGVSPIVATILLIFFAIALGAVIMNWGSNYSELQEDIEKKSEEARIKCSNLVKISVVTEDLADFCVLPAKKLLKLKLKNEGDIAIDGIRLILYGENNFETEFFDIDDLNLAASDMRLILQTYDFDRLKKVKSFEIIPKIDMRMERKLYSCDMRVSADSISYC